MIIKTKAVVLSRMNYSESDLIIRLYTKDKGLISVIQKNVRKSKKKITGFFQPLNILEIELNYLDKRELQYVKEYSNAYKLKDIHFDFNKTAISFFLAELTYKSIGQIEKDTELYEFIEKSILYLDAIENNTSNFHLIYMVKLAGYLGFGLSEIKDINHLLLSVLQKLPNKDLIDKFLVVIETNYIEMNNIKLNKNERTELLDILLKFYYTQIETMTSIKSLEVLSAVFNDSYN